MKRLAVISLILLALLLSTISITATPIYDRPEPSESKPTLIVQKWIDQDEIELGETVVVHVNITNVSDKYARNLTITEPYPADFSIDLERNYTEYTYVSLGQGAVIFYEYSMTPRVEGEFSIEPTRIQFWGDDGRLYRAQSAHIELTVFVEEPAPDNSELWKDVLWFSLGFAGIPIIIYYANRFIKR